MPKLTPEKLAEAIRDAGFTAARLSREIGRDKDYVRDYLIGRKRSLKAEDLEKIAEKLGGDLNEPSTLKEVALENDLSEMPVIGTIRAGAWIETYMLEHDDQGTIPVAKDRRFLHAKQYALAVAGDSMDLEAPDGSFVVCVDFGDSGLTLKPGMLVHVEAMEHGKSETTLKKVSFENGKTVLHPRSSNPIYKPLILGGDEAFYVVVKGVVLSVFNPKFP
ncbi:MULTISPECIES: LexA family protein [Chelativorans]|jgi:SOS-response transcriptional repressor LexA|uniref:Putative prophage repressor n=1 Tax=Chelativorans sp. (strain BNC1) TaxID=266779 RepID=Q11LW0_CHESB|nr:MULTISPECIES: LexA family transcriptional regulator [Chelativorans]